MYFCYEDIQKTRPMKKFSLAIIMVLAAFSITGCRTSEKASSSIKSEVWQTMLVKQLDAQIDEQIVTVKYNNGSTLYYKILDNFGNVALTWDRSNGRKSFDDGQSGYKGNISIPSFITAGTNDEFTFRVMEIDQNAFYGCSELTSVDIPYSIARINAGAFKNCDKLEKLTVNEENQSYKADDGVLFSKDGRMLVQYPAQKKDKIYVIGEDVAFICSEAFAHNTYLENVTVGNNVTAISDYAFFGCSNLKSLELGINVRINGIQSFFGCTKLERINAHGMFAPHNSPTVFEKVTKENCKLYVPKGQLMNYKMRLEWMEFKNVQEY